MIRPIPCIACLVFLSLTGTPRPVQGDVAETEPLASVPALPRAAILRFVRTDLEEWRYRRTRVDEDGVWVDEHDPARPGPEHWRLVSVDGRAPTAEELDDYREDRADHSQEDERAQGDEISRLLAPGSVRLLGEDQGLHRYAYDLRSPDGKRERLFRELAGELIVDAEAGRPWVREVRVWNTDTMRPYLGLRIDEAQLVFRFVQAGDWVLPRSVEADWSGEFLLLKDISRRLSFELSDFERVGSNDRPSLGAMP